MKRHFVVALALACAACSPASVTSAPAPLAHTAIDEQGVTLVWEGFNAALDAVNVLRRAGVIKDGTPSAIRLASMIDTTTAALTAASAAQRASNATDYITAMTEARAALLGIREIVKGL